MKSLAEKIANYEARMQSSLIDPAYAARNADAQTNYGAYATEYTAIQQSLHQYLDTAGVRLESYFQYNAFMSECYHISKRAAGLTATANMSAVAAKYIQLGLSDIHVKAIALALFTVVIP
jgi:hypothetical protein